MYQNFVDFDHHMKISVIETRQGSSLPKRLESWLEASGAHRTLLLDCDKRLHSVWSGCRDLCLQVLDEEEHRNPELISKYDYELFAVIGDQKKRIKPRYLSLTDTSIEAERVRNYRIGFYP